MIVRATIVKTMIDNIMAMIRVNPLVIANIMAMIRVNPLVLEVVGEEVEEVDNIDYDNYPYERPSDWSCIFDGSSRSGPRYDKYGREIPKLG